MHFLPPNNECRQYKLLQRTVKKCAGSKKKIIKNIAHSKTDDVERSC